MPCIYKITNSVNGKVYVGQTTKTLPRRFAQHIHNALRESNYYDCALRRAIRKYGQENFVAEIVEECEDSELDEREIYWVEYYDSFRNGYNCTYGGNSRKHLVGWHLSEKHRQSLREGHKHRDRSTYTGGAKTPEGKAKAVAKFKQTYWSTPEEIRKERTRRAVANRKPVRYWEGKDIPQEMRYKISNTLKQKHLCPPHALPVYCYETNTTYRSMTEAEEKTGIDRHIIKRYIEGKRKDNKYHFEYVDKKGMVS